LVALGAILLVACGGQTTGKPASAQREAPEETEEPGAPPADDEESAAAPPTADACADGSCFECGAGFCLAGFFCDEGAEGGAACSWLPSCPARASCDCIERVLGPGCKCQKSGGGVSVSCS
jgi:hypothetical protein